MAQFVARGFLRFDELVPEALNTAFMAAIAAYEVAGHPPGTPLADCYEDCAPIRNLLQLNQGSIVELDRLAGEPLDVLINGTLVAHGEVVVVNDKFGIRLTDVISAQERVKKLR